MVKYNPSSEGIPKGTPNGKGIYLIIYPKLSPNTDSISLIDSVLEGALIGHTWD